MTLTATLSVLAVALLYDIAINLFYLVVIPPDEYNRKKQIVATWSREMRKAILSKNTKKIAELKKRERIKDEAEAALAVASLKVMVISLVFLWAIFFLLSNFEPFSAARVVLPFEFPFLGDELNFIWWFAFATLAFSLPIRRALGFA